MASCTQAACDTGQADHDRIVPRAASINMQWQKALQVGKAKALCPVCATVCCADGHSQRQACSSGRKPQSQAAAQVVHLQLGCLLLGCDQLLSDAGPLLPDLHSYSAHVLNVFLQATHTRD